MGNFGSCLQAEASSLPHRRNEAVLPIAPTEALNSNDVWRVTELVTNDANQFALVRRVGDRRHRQMGDRRAMDRPVCL